MENILMLLAFLETFGRARHFSEAVMDIYELFIFLVSWRDWVVWFIIISIAFRIYEVYMIRQLYKQIKDK